LSLFGIKIIDKDQRSEIHRYKIKITPINTYNKFPCINGFQAKLNFMAYVIGTYKLPIICTYDDKTDVFCVIPILLKHNKNLKQGKKNGMGMWKKKISHIIISPSKGNKDFNFDFLFWINVKSVHGYRKLGQNSRQRLLKIWHSQEVDFI
jgi:hypothetical protein